MSPDCEQSGTGHRCENVLPTQSHLETVIYADIPAAPLGLVELDLDQNKPFFNFITFHTSLRTVWSLTVH